MDRSNLLFSAGLCVILCVSRILAASIPQSPGLLLTPPAAAPEGARPVTPSFPSLAFEFGNLSFYAGNGSHPITLSQNLVTEISKRTNSPVYIRLGGNSGDNVIYNASLPGSLMTNNFQIGPAFFDGVRNIPNARWILQVRLKPGNGASLQNSIDMAQAGINAITPQNLYSIEIGNEPNNWPHPSLSDYVQRFRDFEQGLATNISAIPPGPIFQCLDTLALVYPGAQQYYPSDILGNDTLDQNGRIKSVAGHYYQTIGPFDLQENITNHNAVMSNLNGYVPSIDYLAKNYPKLPYILDEVGDGLQLNYSELRGLGSALWAIDFQLYAATIGVYRAHFTNEVNQGFNVWTPDPPYIAGTYYALPYVADFIGGQGDMRISAVNISNNSQGFFSAYAAYESGKLVRIALLNMRVWTNDSAAAAAAAAAPVARQSQNFTVALPPGLKSVRAEPLNAAGGATAQTGLTWAGMEWTVATDGVGVKVANTTSNIPIVSNAATVQIPDSSAMMLFVE